MLRCREEILRIMFSGAVVRCTVVININQQIIKYIFSSESIATATKDPFRRTLIIVEGKKKRPIYGYPTMEKYKQR